LGEIAAVPAAAVYLGTATGELEEALGDAGPPGAASEMKPNRFVFQPRRSMDSLIRRFRSSQEADDHEQITSVP
ncbi:MAG: hypothetical protein PVJ15_09390, partial [Gammaproteobacteria bacterium]